MRTSTGTSSPGLIRKQDKFSVTDGSGSRTGYASASSRRIRIQDVCDGIPTLDQPARNAKCKSQSIWYTLNLKKKIFFLICPFCPFCIYRNAEFFKFLFYLNKLPLKNCLFFYLDAKEIVEQSNNKVVVEKETSERMPAKILSTEPVGH